MLLRFAWVLCRGRDSTAIPDFTLTASAGAFSAVFAAEWLEGHPLTIADLDQERSELQALGVSFDFGAG
jgi:exopolyphosphatase/guanosine-5'-triphosphate,3'-diphosphate pyrophosphatase